MKSAAFDYRVARDAKDASRECGSDAVTVKVVAGAQSLGPMLNLRLVRPELLIDVAMLPELRETRESADAVSLGAAITHAEIEDGEVPDPTPGWLRKSGCRNRPSRRAKSRHARWQPGACRSSRRLGDRHAGAGRDCSRGRNERPAPDRHCRFCYRPIRDATATGRTHHGSFGAAPKLTSAMGLREVHPPGWRLRQGERHHPA